MFGRGQDIPPKLASMIRLLSIARTSILCLATVAPAFSSEGQTITAPVTAMRKPNIILILLLP